MRRLLVAAFALGMIGTSVMADPAEGIWQTQPDDGAFAFVRIVPCGAAVCGTITRSFNEQGEYESPNLGRQIVIDMVPQGDGSYRGQVWRPSNDKIYTGNMTMDGDRLRLRGCVLGGLICASQTWVRVQ